MEKTGEKFSLNDTHRDMKEIKVYIDTTSSEETLVSLEIAGEKHTEKRPRSIRKEQEVLQIIKTLLEAHGLSLQDITAIEVNQGSGSFTGVRVGVTIANILGFTLGVKVNGQDFVEPVYQ